METISLHDIERVLLLTGSLFFTYLGYRTFIYSFDKGLITRRKDPAYAKIVLTGLGTGLSCMVLGGVILVSGLLSFNSHLPHRLDIMPAVQTGAPPVPSPATTQLGGEGTVFPEAQGNVENLQLDGAENSTPLSSRDILLQNQTEEALLEDNDEIDFMIAKSLYEEKDYRNALAHFSILAENSRTRDYRVRSRFYCGECFFHLGKLDQAILHYQEAIALDASHALTTKALLQQANAFADLGSYKLSSLLLERLVEQFPVSEESSIAALMLQND